MRQYLPYHGLVLSIAACLLLCVASHSERKSLALNSNLRGKAKIQSILSVPAARADRFGVYNWNINDAAFPNDGTTDRLNWGANKIAELGSRTIRITITTRDDYRINPSGNLSLVQ